MSENLLLSKAENVHYHDWELTTFIRFINRYSELLVISLEQCTDPGM